MHHARIMQGLDQNQAYWSASRARKMLSLGGVWSALRLSWRFCSTLWVSWRVLGQNQGKGGGGGLNVIV